MTEAEWTSMFDDIGRLMPQEDVPNEAVPKGDVPKGDGTR
jgi:hypothetical protein